MDGLDLRTEMYFGLPDNLSKGFPKNIQGVQKKMSRSFCLIPLAKNMLEGKDIINLKAGIHSFVWSTKTFLYNIWQSRYKQMKMGYQIQNV